MNNLSAVWHPQLADTSRLQGLSHAMPNFAWRGQGFAMKLGGSSALSTSKPWTIPLGLGTVLEP
eukprot:6635223-Alexandrium_andersonii.AAC.1